MKQQSETLNMVMNLSMMKLQSDRQHTNVWDCSQFIISGMREVVWDCSKLIIIAALGVIFLMARGHGMAWLQAELQRCKQSGFLRGLMCCLISFEGLMYEKKDKTAEEMLMYFKPLLIKERRVYRRIKPAYVRPAKSGDVVYGALANSAAEWCKPVVAQDETSWEIADPTRFKEHRLLQNHLFRKSYPHVDLETWQQLDEISESQAASDEFLEEMKREGFKEVQPQRLIWVKRLDKSDVAWIYSRGGTGRFQIGQTRSKHVQEGDELAMGFPLDNAVDVYLLPAIQDLFTKVNLVLPLRLQSTLGAKFDAITIDQAVTTVEAKHIQEGEIVVHHSQTGSTRVSETPQIPGVMLVRSITTAKRTLEEPDDWRRQDWQPVAPANEEGFEMYQRSRNVQAFAVTEADLAQVELPQRPCVIRSDGVAPHIWLETKTGKEPIRIQVGDIVAREQFNDGTYRFEVPQNRLSQGLLR
mmetsp:Transcript_85654/g.161332  ORF Transcript_85654/g.161332 Transcript_85654/m.161332 type:complete len:470 (+) Transcript_85654:1-1410(+)